MERDEVFDEDYLYFYETLLTEEVSDRQADLIWRLLELEEGMEVLDLACGHGRIANRLAERGARVTGLDATPLFLQRAREDAERRGVDVEYVEGDMRDLPWEERFDRAVCWFTSFGYFEDDENRQVLRGVRRALKPGGAFLLDVQNLPFILRNLQADSVWERGGDLMIDRHDLDLSSGRMNAERIIVRGGHTRRFPYFVRMFTFTELRGWLLAAGFSNVTAHGRGEGDELTLESPRLFTLARR